MEEKECWENLKREFQDCKNVLTALGDETRQLIIIALMDTECSVGIRVGEITKKTHLSRPAVSHHLKILKDAKIINVNRQGTMNFYYLDSDQSQIMLLGKLVRHIEELMVQDKER